MTIVARGRKGFRGKADERIARSRIENVEDDSRASNAVHESTYGLAADRS